MAVIPPTNLDPNAAPWGRWATENIIDLTTSAGRTKLDLSNANKQLNASIKALSQQIVNQPYVATGGATATNVAAISGFVTQVQVVLPVPPTKTVANVMAIVNAQYLDVASAGAAVATGRIFIGRTPLVGGENGTFSQVTSAAKDAGASQVNNILNLGYSAQLTGLDPVNLDPNIYITFQVSATNGNAYPAQTANFAQLAVQATFTNNAVSSV